jgi:hypothetical protein
MTQSCANSSCLACIKVTDGEVNNYNYWLHINDVVKDKIGLQGFQKTRKKK